MEMAMADADNELRMLIENEIPAGRQNLEDSYANLERVAAYCEANYQQANDKKAALEETRRYTVQSLASVAYQVNTLASSLLQTLDLQTDKVAQMTAQVNSIAQIVDFHKEKVARREIGMLTASKSTTRQHKIVAPVHQEKAQRYVRKAIDYSELDDLGHGVRLAPVQGALVGSQQQRHLLARTGSTASGGSAGSGGSAPHFNSYHADPVQQLRGGSMSRATGGHYRAPAIIPGVTPNELVQRQRSAQSAAYAAMAPPSVQHSMSQQHAHHSHYVVQQSPWLQQTAGGLGEVGGAQHLPPPPSPNSLAYPSEPSPPLPPPPMDELVHVNYNDVIPDMPQYGTYVGRRAQPDWLPQHYLEKVVALYDYEAAKPDELSFEEGAVVYVLRKNEDGWFEGVLDGVTGLFPGNYVEPTV